MEFAAVIANGARDGRKVVAVRVHRTLRAVRMVLDPGANDVLQSSQRDPKDTLNREAELLLLWVLDSPILGSWRFFFYWPEPARVSALLLLPKA